MESRHPRPPPYRVLPPTNVESGAVDTENQRQPLLRSNQPSYGPINTPHAIPKSEQSTDRSSLPWKMALIFIVLLIFNAAVIVYSSTDHRTPEERERARWEMEREREAHRKEHEKWERDRIEWNREIEKRRKEEEQRRRAAEEQREKMDYRTSGMHWDELRPSRCLEYGIREYTAHLVDVPSAYDRRKGCKYMPITINGLIFESPTYCDDRGWRSGVFGLWQVGKETLCMPYWDKWYEHGCTGVGSGKRRLQALLLDLQTGDDRNRMCETAPAIIHGVHYPSPTHCHDFGNDMYGIWDIDDRNCH